MTQNPEYKYQVALFSIRALSNLHAGSASENYGIIDNLVQRDAATGFPCINASSLKGALREYFRNYLASDDKGKEMITYIFGLDKKDGDANTEDQSEAETSDQDSPKKKNFEEKQIAGAYRFLSADLLSIPLRGLEKPFFNASCPWLLENLHQQLCLFDRKLKDPWLQKLTAAKREAAIHFGGGTAEVDLDNVTLQDVGKPDHLSQAEKVLGDSIALLSDGELAELVSDFRLPVIARNNLEDGRSANLWYEQVLPRETRMAFFVLYPKGKEKQFEAFKAAIEAFPVQIGANASVGYGFCSIEEIKLEEGK
jgi:CRISPR-associated protein Cmr4